jgi:hypothetical protein
MDADDGMIAHHRDTVGGLDRLLYIACGDDRGGIPLAGANGVDEIAPGADIDPLERVRRLGKGGAAQPANGQSPPSGDFRRTAGPVCRPARCNEFSILRSRVAR